MSIVDAPSDLKIERQQISGATLVRLRGRADTMAIGTLQTELQLVVDQRPKIVVLDFAGVTFISSRAIGALVELQRGISRNRGSVRIIGASSMVLEALRYTRLDSVFGICQSLDDALAA